MELNAKRTMCCVLLIPKGILWDDEKIYIVLMIAVQKKDRNEFMELYEAILHSLDSPDKIQQLLHSHTFDDFVKHLMVQE